MSCCRDLMKTDLKCIYPEDSVHDAACRMRDTNIGFLPVCDETGEAIGTVTDRDLAIRALAEKLPYSTPVQNVMSRDIVACTEDDPIERAEELMGQHHVSRILCTDENGLLVGVISLSDLAEKADGPAVVDTLRQIASREAHV